MSDVFDAAARSSVMRAVRSRDTAPELTVRRLLRELGRRYRLDARDLPGRPDIVFRGAWKVIFVHGCFWHGHDCARGARAPKANAEYWARKIARNRVRDAAGLAALKRDGWRTLVIWECALKDEAAVRRRLARFLSPAAYAPRRRSAAPGSGTSRAG
jgi:DNA mismatch endonuclease (patch repair protein)